MRRRPRQSRPTAGSHWGIKPRWFGIVVPATDPQDQRAINDCVADVRRAGFMAESTVIARNICDGQGALYRRTDSMVIRLRAGQSGISAQA